MSLNPPVLQSLIADRWVGTQAARALHSAINGRPVALTHADEIDFGESLHFARRTALPALMAMDFQQRAAILKALGAHINTHKEQLYAVSAHTGATRADSWIDIEGGSGTLYAYASLGAAELPSSNVMHEGPVSRLGKLGHFAGTHILVPRGGVAVHIEAAVRVMMSSGLLPPGALQLVIGGTGDLLDRLEEPDVVTFTGSADTAATLKVNANIIRRSIPFNAEADSLNCAILGPDVSPDDEEFELFVKEVAKEMTAKAGQKCTAIRRAIVPRQHIDAVAEKLRARLAKITVGDPAIEGVRMGALASKAQQADVAERLALLSAGNELIFSARDGFAPQGEGVAEGAFFSPSLLLCRDAFANEAVHNIEAFGPVSTLMPYDDLGEALALAAKGRGSLVGTLVTKTPSVALQMIPLAAAHHGRMLILDREAAKESTGHGSPLPQLKHGGPGRAGGGEELGGLRAVKHYLQRAAIQGSPTMLTAVTGEYQRGAAFKEDVVHPFRKHFEEIQVGDSLLTHRRTVTEADIVNFGGISGDYFYMHFDEIAAKQTQFGKRIAHGYFVLSAAAGLFVSPAPGPVLANYGLDTLRFIKPVGIGDTIQARLTCKRKIDRPTKKDQAPQGVVVWDVEVTNQEGEPVASYDILTLVEKLGAKTIPV